MLYHDRGEMLPSDHAGVQEGPLHGEVLERGGQAVRNKVCGQMHERPKDGMPDCF